MLFYGNIVDRGTSNAGVGLINDFENDNFGQGI